MVMLPDFIPLLIGRSCAEHFGRALRLCWPLLQWTAPDQPWHGSELPCDAIDMDLFRATMKIAVGDGMKTSF